MEAQLILLKRPALAAASSLVSSTTRPLAATRARTLPLPLLPRTLARHESSRSRTIRKQNVAPHPSFLQPADSDRIIFNPPSSAPSVYNTPFKFLPKEDPRRQANLANIFAAASASASDAAAAEGGGGQVVLGKNSAMSRSLGTGSNAQELFSSPSPSPLPSPSPQQRQQTYPAGGVSAATVTSAAGETKTYALGGVDKLPLVQPQDLRGYEKKQFSLTREDVDQMRRLRAEDPHKWTVATLAAKFKCSKLFVMISCPASPEYIKERRAQLDAAKKKLGVRGTRAKWERSRRLAMLFNNEI